LRLPIKDAEKFCRWLLSDFQYNKQTVMLSPASGFYSSPRKGKNEVRIAYVLKKDDLKNALVALDAALKKYKD
jgi:aspartate aminotransferase